MSSGMPLLYFWASGTPGWPPANDEEDSSAQKGLIMLACRPGKMIIFNIGILLLCSSVLSCRKQTVEGTGGEKQMPTRSIQEVLEERTDAWMALPGVVGTAIGEIEGEPCIKVFVAEESAELKGKIPAQVEGFAVIVEAIGEIRALEPGD